MASFNVEVTEGAVKVTRKDLEQCLNEKWGHTQAVFDVSGEVVSQEEFMDILLDEYAERFKPANNDYSQDEFTKHLLEVRKDISDDYVVVN